MAPIRTLVEKVYIGTKAPKLRSRKRDSLSFNILTKNALQNVVQFFRPWGRDFCVLRRVNKRIHAAYHNHLKRVVNIADYMHTVHEVPL